MAEEGGLPTTTASSSTKKGYNIQETVSAGCSVSSKLVCRCISCRSPNQALLSLEIARGCGGQRLAVCAHWSSRNTFL